jgi:hypothetical protein
MNVYLAASSSDVTVTPSSQTFPAFATTTHTTNSGGTLSGTFNLAGYFELTATPTTTFAQTPNFVFTSSTISGSTCYLFSLNNSSSNGTYTPVWSQVFQATSKTSTTVTFSPQTLTNGTVQLGNAASNSSGNGPTYLAVACQ